MKFATSDFLTILNVGAKFEITVKPKQNKTKQKSKTKILYFDRHLALNEKMFFTRKGLKQ